MAQGGEGDALHILNRDGSATVEGTVNTGTADERLHPAGASSVADVLRHTRGLPLVPGMGREDDARGILIHMIGHGDLGNDFLKHD